MARDEEFHRRYVEAVFRRGRKGTLPLGYILGEASKVLRPDEMEEFRERLDAMTAQGLLERNGEDCTLKA